MSRSFDSLKQLIPIELSGAHEADLEIEGDHLDQAAANDDLVLRQAFVDTAIETLSDWERQMGIIPPDGRSVAARLAAAVAKYNERGGLSLTYFKALAASMGYEIEIEESDNGFMAGIGMAGYPLGNDPFIFEVQVLNAEPPTFPFRAGVSCAGDSLLSFGFPDIEEKIRDLKPAHTNVYFTYPD